MADSLLTAFAPHDEMIGQLNEDSRLVSQSRKELTENGTRWIQYELVFEEIHGGERFLDTFLVDIATDLPKWWIRSSPDRKKTLRFQIDYPEAGPQNVFDLGVPRLTPFDQ